MYHVVKFLKTDETGVVPNTWLHGRDYCFWPKFRTTNQLNRWVKTRCPPNKDTWKLYSIGIMYSSDSYDKVRRKLSLSTVMSNLDTEAEEDGESRKRRPARKLLDSSDEETVSVSKKKVPQAQSSQVPIPPPPPQIVISSQQHESTPLRSVSPLPSLSSYSSPRRSPRRQVPLEPTVSSYSSPRQSPRRQVPLEPTVLSYRSPRRSPRRQVPFEPTVHVSSYSSPRRSPRRQVPLEPTVLSYSSPRRSPRRQVPFEPTVHVSSYSSPRRSPRRQVPLEPSVLSYRRTSPRRSPRRQVLQEPTRLPYRQEEPITTPSARPQTMGTTRGEVIELVRIVESTRAVAQENQKLLHQVLRMLQSPDSTASNPSEELMLPLTTVEELREANTSLVDASRFRSAVGQLGVAGGVSTGDTVRRVLSMLMINSVAKKVNWKGTSGKEPFQQMKLRELVIKAVRKNPVCARALDCEVENHIKLWFRYAPDRDGGRRERTLLAKQKKTSQVTAAATPDAGETDQ